ncbi:hypothetical protein F4818DRAFT_434349 [Hypoxylon cercidicola]|nr:hypothetical protein F4818DRAFT_434349 [Hypoxylon cercidicola]
MGYNLIRPFLKWTNAEYDAVFMSPTYHVPPIRDAEMRHFRGGLILLISYVRFIPTDKNQTRLVMKDSTGWHYHETSPYCLQDPEVSISDYIKACVYMVLSNFQNNVGPIPYIFQLAKQYISHPAVWTCLELYTSLQLMMLPLEFAGDQTLDMEMVEDENSLWYGQVPVPRMVKSQLGHLLEMNIVQLDQLLQSVRLKNGQPMDLPVRILIYFFLLHVRELDGARNIYWKRFADPDNFWQHPAHPAYLLEEATASCKQLLYDFRHFIGWNPRVTDSSQQGDPGQVEWLTLLRQAIGHWGSWPYLLNICSVC